eukprot:TRINITY_DN3421_c0_g1_i2.p1 TRINITY_DN3421_c0_g1~~TRINITY_DN3421_c0_g1_i2.p1  ORF type:complete len:105 (+),score=43.02 TRINITY_DN3421_c0_g1_i2:101-415(+)
MEKKEEPKKEDPKKDPVTDDKKDEKKPDGTKEEVKDKPKDGDKIPPPKDESRPWLMITIIGLVSFLAIAVLVFFVIRCLRERREEPSRMELSQGLLAKQEPAQA